MNVRHLIEALNKFDPDLPVMFESEEVTRFIGQAWVAECNFLNAPSIQCVKLAHLTYKPISSDERRSRILGDLARRSSTNRQT
jgi:hypothetical protein